MDDIGDIILGPHSRLADATTVQSPISGEFEWGSKYLEASWVVALGRSRFLCVGASSLFHLIILLLFLISFPIIGDRYRKDVPSVIPVQLVTIGDETNMAAMVRRQLPFAPSDQQVEATKPTTTPGNAPGVEMKLFPTEPSEQPKPVTPKEEGGSTAEGRPSSLRDAKIGDYNVNKVGAGTAMTMSLSDFLRNQIVQCWRPPSTAKLDVVVFELFLDGSGSIERPPRLIEPLAQTPSAIAAAESVRHAIYTCAPYRLPAERAQQWRQVTLSFDPRMVRAGGRLPQGQ